MLGIDLMEPLTLGMGVKALRLDLVGCIRE